MKELIKSTILKEINQQLSLSYNIQLNAFLPFDISLPASNKTVTVSMHVIDTDMLTPKGNAKYLTYDGLQIALRLDYKEYCIVCYTEDSLVDTVLNYIDIRSPWITSLYESWNKNIHSHTLQEYFAFNDDILRKYITQKHPADATIESLQAFYRRSKLAPYAWESYTSNDDMKDFIEDIHKFGKFAREVYDSNPLASEFVNDFNAYRKLTMRHKMTMSTYQYRNPAVYDMFKRLVIECDTSYILY